MGLLITSFPRKVTLLVCMYVRMYEDMVGSGNKYEVGQLASETNSFECGQFVVNCKFIFSNFLFRL